MPDRTTQVTSVQHLLVVVISPECDLVSIYESRSAASSGAPVQSQSSSNLLEHIQCCKLFEEAAVRNTSGMNSAAWSFVKSNRHERYHMIPPNVPGRSDNSGGVKKVDFGNKTNAGLS